MSEARKEQLADGVTLWLGDCRDVLPEVDRSCVIVSDVPYGISFAKGESGKRVTGSRLTASRWIDPIIGDGIPFDPQLLLGFSEVILFGADHFRLRLPEGGRFLAWDKRVGVGPNDTFSDVEFIWHSVAGSSKIINHLWKGVCQDSEKGYPKFHIMQKPIAVMEWCLGQLRDKTSTVVDPYMGSGSTGLACLISGRSFIGVEIDPTYFDIARRRISEALRRPRLPFEEPRKAVQAEMTL